MLRRLIFIFAGVLALLCPLAALAANMETTPSGVPLQGGAPLQGGTPASAMPYQTAVPSGLPSGQGMQSPLPGSAQPLYVPGDNPRQAKNFIGGPAWSQQSYVAKPDIFPPFGANLFQGRFAGTYQEGTNSSYTIMPGDRILIHIWGSRSYTDTLMVDQQGNIFVPEIGPVPVAGLNQKGLKDAVRNYLSSVFRANVEAYVNLLTAQPVAVYVTGFVTSPGRYAGGMNDSVLYYLDRAGGIVAERGSYRDIVVQRGGKVISRTDLYPFILSGRIASPPMQDGDVIVVGPKKGSIAAFGMIPQHACYESAGKTMSGDELTRLASPEPSVSHVSVTGSRDANLFNVYMSLDEFRKFTLAANDTVEFLADKPSESIMVSVSGSILGSSRYPVKRPTTLRQLLAHVPVDNGMANLDGIYIKRKSTVAQQKKAIDDSMRRLESAVLMTPSASAETAAIRVQEANLVQNFVQRVGMVQPDGVVVVTQRGHTADILLEDGDEVVIPQRSDVVHITGEIMVPKSVVYNPNMKMKDYVAASGGFTDRADKGYVLAVHPNGEIVDATAQPVQPGDLIMVMPYADPKGFQILKDIMQVLYQIAVATKVVVSI